MTEAVQTHQIALMSATGLIYRTVSSEKARDCTPDEIPIIDVARLWGSLEDRKELAREVLHACENTGFFYIKNHGITNSSITKVLDRSKEFFYQPEELRQKASRRHAKHLGGYLGRADRAGGSPTGKINTKEVFVMKYDPKFDPTVEDFTKIPEEVNEGLHAEEFYWQATQHIDGFQDALVGHWRSCLDLARRLIKIFAIALELPENYFEHLVTYPGADLGVGLYPGWPEGMVAKEAEMGLNAHTDVQCFTLLWQDNHGGLEVLNRESQWVRVKPMDDTLVVNIGDFLMRLTNNRFQSTIHQVVPHDSPEDRMSVAFFFGFNFNEQCSVVPTCITPENPKRYEPVVCGDYVQQRLEAAESFKVPMKG
ncbi:hypothetical protein PMG11_11299 [Penicillium brasilianum]|uniref:Fe2OG dioxygenase domain-containing protein n=1 Tax=Penicillium brasilianum TaxID=104259 RepID=A0A0F7U5Q9_PENBI|nr:hypothetical protein PMG11_11299 [Penicillium brasilianum]